MQAIAGQRLPGELGGGRLWTVFRVRVYVESNQQARAVAGKHKIISYLHTELIKFVHLIDIKIYFNSLSANGEEHICMHCFLMLQVPGQSSSLKNHCKTAVTVRICLSNKVLKCDS